MRSRPTAMGISTRKSPLRTNGIRPRSPDRREPESLVQSVDDLLEQATWPDGHQARVDNFLATIEAEPGLVVSRLHWDSGLVIAAKVAE